MSDAAAQEHSSGGQLVAPERSSLEPATPESLLLDPVRPEHLPLLERGWELLRSPVIHGGKPLWLRWKEAGYTSADILADFEIKTAPVDVYGLAMAMGVHVHELPEPGWEGAVQSTQTRADIWVREDAPLVRRRFTLAHELGHLMLHPLGELFRDADPGVIEHPLPERQANLFAASLLMPRAMVLPLVYETPLSVEQMARMFVVSQHAMSIRVAEVMRGRSDL